jgi:hypothetical protein
MPSELGAADAPAVDATTGALAELLADTSIDSATDAPADSTTDPMAEVADDVRQSCSTTISTRTLPFVMTRTAMVNM